MSGSASFPGRTVFLIFIFDFLLIFILPQTALFPLFRCEKIKSKNRERSKKITKKKKSKRLCGFVGLGREKRGKNEELGLGNEGGRKNKWEIENENVF